MTFPFAFGHIITYFFPIYYCIMRLMLFFCFIANSDIAFLHYSELWFQFFFMLSLKYFAYGCVYLPLFALNISCFITQCDSSMDITRCLMLSLWILLWVKYASRWWKRLLWSFFTIALDQVHDFKSKSNFQWLQCFIWML